VVNMFLHTTGPLLGSAWACPESSSGIIFPSLLATLWAAVVFIGMLFYSTHRSPSAMCWPLKHDERLERGIGCEAWCSLILALSR